MPTALNMKCSFMGCGLSLRVVSVNSDGITCICSAGHRKRYTKRYFKRFVSPENVRGDLLQECPKCHKPIIERSRTAQNYAKQLGRAECSGCQTVFLYDSNTNKWVVADE